MPAQRLITLEELSQYFHLPEKVVAKKLGVCLTSLKKLCRQHSIHRWPYRKLKSIEKKIEKLESSLANPAEDAQAVRCKLTSLKFEKKRLPFTGVPSSAYGGVRRANSSPANSSFKSAQSWTNGGDHSPSASDRSSAATPRSTSPCSFVSGNSKLAARLRAVGSVNEHRQRLAATLGVNWEDGAMPFMSAEAISDSASEYGYTSAEELTDQPEEEPEEGLLSGDPVSNLMFEAPVDPFFGAGVDMPSLTTMDYLPADSCRLEDAMCGDALDTAADDFFATPIF